MIKLGVSSERIEKHKITNRFSIEVESGKDLGGQAKNGENENT